jgi:SAM-dependent methyltransferase
MWWGRNGHNMLVPAGTRWPKSLPALTPEQQRIREDFMRYWLDVLPQRYGLIERINHRYALGRRPAAQCATLEIGGGTGAHVAYEDLTRQDYTVLELREELAGECLRRYPQVRVVIGDVQRRIDAPDQTFDRVLAIHVLEHLPNLPAALEEIKRVMKPDGYFSAVIPCEGGMAYEMARTISARRLFEKRYGCSYDWFVKSEHVNTVWELLEELPRYFRVVQQSYWPLRIPSVQMNVVMGLTCVR